MNADEDFMGNEFIIFVGRGERESLIPLPSETVSMSQPLLPPCPITIAAGCPPRSVDGKKPALP